MIGPFGRQGPAATLRPYCPPITRGPGKLVRSSVLYTYFLQKHYNLLWLFSDSAIGDILPQIEHVSPPVLSVACCVNQKVEAEMKEIAVLARICVSGNLTNLAIHL